MDTQLHLIGFDNGVYDLTSNTFRNMTRDDKITMTTGYNYEHVYDAQDYHEELDLLLKQIFPDTDILEYMLCFLGSCLCGKVNEELIHFWTGLSNKQTGSNGKSTFVSLLLLTFGDYAMCGHSSIITSKRENSSSANSALMALKGVRLVTFQEIDDVNNINMPVIKSLTGNDTVSGRQLYKTQETFLPQWHLVVCANKLPPVSSDDGGTQRRLRNVLFESKFVDNQVTINASSHQRLPEIRHHERITTVSQNTRTHSIVLQEPEHAVPVLMEYYHPVSEQEHTYSVT